MRGTLCLSKMCFQASLWGPFSLQLWSSRTSLTVLPEASGAWDRIHLFNFAGFVSAYSQCLSPFPESAHRICVFLDFTNLGGRGRKKQPLSLYQLWVIHNRERDDPKLGDDSVMTFVCFWSDWIMAKHHMWTTWMKAIHQWVPVVGCVAFPLWYLERGTGRRLPQLILLSLSCQNPGHLRELHSTGVSNPSFLVWESDI